jgi:DNA (cytosine-5)-methyltransferase 1
VNYLSVCSGIEAASVAWHPLGWRPVAFSEIEKFPSAVLAHHWPDVPNLGDMTKFNEWNIKPIDLLVGGTPCQSFSVAGLRKGLEDPRGNLALTFLAMADRFRPSWVVWENVPGVLSDRTNAFGQFLTGLGELGYEYAYRVLDAQYYGVPQRRRRVFVVGCARGAGIHPAKVLFEPESLCRDLTPSREAGEGSAGNTAHCLRADGFDAGEDGTGRGTPLVPQVAPTLSAESYSPTKSSSGQQADWCIPQIANPLTARMHKGINTTLDEGQTPIPASFYSNDSRMDNIQTDGSCVPLKVGSGGTSGQPPAIAFETRFARNGRGAPSEVVPPLKAQSGETGKGDAAPCVAFGIDSEHNGRAELSGPLQARAGTNNLRPSVSLGMQVRRLTPTECERLQGFPDNHTRIPWRGKPAEDCPDGPRYKALGNSMAVPVMRWIGERIQEVTK